MVQQDIKLFCFVWVKILLFYISFLLIILIRIKSVNTPSKIVQNIFSLTIIDSNLVQKYKAGGGNSTYIFCFLLSIDSDHVIITCDNTITYKVINL